MIERTTRIRRFFAVLAAVTLALVGVTPAAHGATSTLVTGRIVLPPGAEIDHRHLRIGGQAVVEADLTFAADVGSGDALPLRFDHGPNLLVRGYYGAGGAVVPFADAIPVEPGTSGIVIRPALAATITGKVTLEGGAPLERFPEITLYEESESWFVNSYIRAVVEPDGSFRMPGVRPGTKSVLWVNVPSGYARGFVARGTLTEDPNVAQAIPAGATGVDFEIRRVGSLAGVVESDIGVPVEGTRITCLGREYVGDSWTRQRGNATVLADGSFELRVHPGNPCHLRLEPAGGEPLFWTSDHTLPSSNPAHAGETFPRTDVRFPDRNYLLSLTAPRVTGSAAVDETLQADVGTWNHDAPRFAYQWLRSGATIPGATSASYPVTSADVGSRLAVRITATAAGFEAATETSAATAAVPVPAPVPVPVPQVTPKVTAKLVKKGTTRSKVRLKVKVRATSVTSTPVGKLEVRFAKKTRTFSLKASHRGNRTVTIPRGKARGTVAVRYLPTGSSQVTLTTATITTKVTKVAPKVKVKTKKRISRTARAKLAIRVKTPLAAKPTGKIKVFYGKKSRTVKLKARHKGKVTVRLPRLAKGKHKVRVRYIPAKKYKPYLKAKKSKTVTIRVR